MEPEPRATLKVAWCVCWGGGAGSRCAVSVQITGSTRCVSSKQRPGDDIFHKKKQIQYAIECNIGTGF